MRHKRVKIRPRGPMRDNSRNISVRMTDEQYRQLQRYRKLTRLTSTTYFRRLIQDGAFKGFSPELNHALHASLNMIYSNVRQITRHKQAKDLDVDAVAKLTFLMDKLCEEIYLLANQK